MKNIGVLYDREIFVRQNFGGISRYFSELFRQFRTSESLLIDPLLGFSRSSNVHLQETLQNLSLEMPPLRPSLRGLPRLMNGPGLVKDAFFTYRAGRNPHGFVDIIHATYLRPRATDRHRARYRVVTIQDVIAEDLNFPRRHPARRGKGKIICEADLIITTSALTASTLKADWPNASFCVIPLGVGDEFFAEQTNEPPIVPFPYVLFVGARSSYKNFKVLVEALQLVRKNYDVGLVCTGPPMSTLEMQEMDFLLQHRRFRHVQATDEQLPGLYRNSSGFVFPSRMEGFGLPVLEAAASGCPVILSDIPAFRELADSWAKFFDPTSPDNLALALTQILENPELGLAPTAVRANLPTWRTSAQLHAKAYAGLLRH